MRYEYAVPAAEAAVEDRLSFLHKTYLHLGGAILAFIAVESWLISSPLGERIVFAMVANRFMWLLVLVGFAVVGAVAESWARNWRSTGLQYAGLALYVGAEAFLFLPLLWFAAKYGPPDVIKVAALITAVIFVGLTAIVFLTKADFSWMRGLLHAATLGAIGLIVASILFGFSLGLVFCAAMVVIAAGWILYRTSQILHQFPVGAHVAASLVLFAAVALLFWYVLRIALAVSRR